MKRKSTKVLSVLVIAILLFTLSACGSGSKESGSSDGGLKDGTYTKKSEMTDHGYEEVDVVIKDGKIESVNLKRIGADEKEVNYDEWDGSADLPNLKDIRVEMSEAMVEKQSADVDSISGATSSGDKWKALVSEALEEAK